MTSNISTSFRRIYIIFLSLLGIICSLFMTFILCIDAISSEVVIITTAFFIIFIFLIGIIFVFLIRKKVLKIFNLLDDMINSAIDEDKGVTIYDDTLFSSLENKILKYIKITKSNKEDIENERNKVKTLVADISHQTKTPISNILLYSQLVLEKDDLDYYTKEILLDIKSQTERLNFLIQSLIKMSRLENGIIKPITGKTKLIDTISKVIQQTYASTNEKDINVSVKCDEEVTACFDIKWTGEALVNILENAIKYTPQGGNIDIVVNSYELSRRIDIKDNGIGIEEHEINNIFKRFYRCKNAKKYEGVGIGLYLAREIISLQGGYIKVSSSIGSGSTFSVFLPS